jgi:hypothetical protein
MPSRLQHGGGTLKEMVTFFIQLASVRIIDQVSVLVSRNKLFVL